MTAIDRTAYPRPGERLTGEELDARYRVSDADHDFIRAHARGDAGRLTLATLLKARQDWGCFPAADRRTSPYRDAPGIAARAGRGASAPR